MAFLDLGAWKALEDEACDGRDVAELASDKLGSVESSAEVVHEVRRREQVVVNHVFPPDGLVGQELEAVVVAGPIEGLGGKQAEAVGQQRGQGFVDLAPFEGVHEQVVAVVVDEGFHQHLVGARDEATLGLDVHHGHEALELGLELGLVTCHLVPRKPQAVGQLGRQGHPPSHPCRGAAGGGLGLAHLGDEALEGSEGDGLSGENERVPFLERGDEDFLHVAQKPDALELHRHHGGADDGAHAHPVPAGLGPVAHDPAPVLVLGDALVLRVGAEGGAPGRNEVHGLAPVVPFHLGVGVGGPHGHTGVGLVEPVPHSQGAEPLDEDVPTQHEGHLGLDVAVLDGRAQGGRFDELEAVGGHEVDFAVGAGAVAASAGALDHARDTLGAADLDDRIHGMEVDAQVEGGRAHHRAQAAVVQGVLHPLAQLLGDGPVVHGQEASPIRLGGQERLVPHLGLTARVGEDQGALMPLHDVHHAVDELEADVARPRQLLERAGHGALDVDLFGDVGPDNVAAVVPNQGAQGFARLRQGGADAPHHRFRTACVALQLLDPRNGELHLNAALGANQLMPFVDHDGVDVGKAATAPFLGHQDVHGLRGGDKHLRQGLLLAGFFLRRGVARPPAHVPVQPQPVHHRPRRLCDVGGQRPQRGDPKQTKSPFATGDTRRLGGRQDVAHGGVGLSASCGRLQQAVFSPCHALPHVQLKWLRRPAPRRKPRHRGRVHILDIWVRTGLGFLFHLGQRNTSFPLRFKPNRAPVLIFGTECALDAHKLKTCTHEHLTEPLPPLDCFVGDLRLHLGGAPDIVWPNPRRGRRRAHPD